MLSVALFSKFRFMVMRKKYARLLIGMVDTSIPGQKCKFSDFNLLSLFKVI